MASVHVLVAIAADSANAASFRTALARFGDRVTLTFATGAEFSRAVPDAEVIVALGLSDDDLALARRLCWMSSWGAGVEHVARPALFERGIVLTNASGVHGPNVAEHLLTMILMFTRRMPRYQRAQLARRWDRNFASRADGADELTGKTLVVVGLGRIGEALATRARPFGLRVVAVKRDPSTRHAASSVDELVGMDGLDEALGRADHVCLIVPLTPETHHLIDARRLALMRSTAYLYNVSRGPVVDQAALVDALRDRRLAGAGLDVFEHEPLPEDSPLWDLDNAILTPHVAGLTPHYFERAAALFADNVERYLAGQPLRNRYDPARGY
ncbi:MAG TPA: D-2-hydroxyacid dehydrogenase [Kofleriaceae bacterium]|jgi:phosphoglycerate dehydrogenase-like enzyme|nr:D-2-hydroxyacid dehydrogenase [Kofleriaceae bacterium]